MAEVEPNDGPHPVADHFEPALRSVQTELQYALTWFADLVKRIDCELRAKLLRQLKEQDGNFAARLIDARDALHEALDLGNAYRTTFNNFVEKAVHSATYDQVMEEIRTGETNTLQQKYSAALTVCLTGVYSKHTEFITAINAAHTQLQALGPAIAAIVKKARQEKFDAVDKCGTTVATTVGSGAVAATGAVIASGASAVGLGLGIGFAADVATVSALGVLAGPFGMAIVGGGLVLLGVGMFAYFAWKYIEARKNQENLKTKHDDIDQLSVTIDEVQEHLVTLREKSQACNRKAKAVGNALKDFNIGMNSSEIEEYNILDFNKLWDAITSLGSTPDDNTSSEG